MCTHLVTRPYMGKRTRTYRKKRDTSVRTVKNPWHGRTGKTRDMGVRYMKKRDTDVCRRRTGKMWHGRTAVLQLYAFIKTIPEPTLML